MINLRKHFSKGDLGFGRIEAFSDRVFAIVVFGVAMA
jgi:uncharacterized membrane protein